MKYLINTTEVYRVDTMGDVEALRTAAEADPNYEVGSLTYKTKVKKLKGEIIDEWYQVSIKKIFNDEKEPEHKFTISYEV